MSQRQAQSPSECLRSADAIRRIDARALAADLAALKQDLDLECGAADVRHLRKMMRWGRLLAAFGFATAWIAPNPLSAVALGLAVFARWAIVGHHVCHGAFDKIEDRPPHLDSRRFGRGWRRFVDWFDWLIPEAWHQEHDLDHHYNLGEPADPDMVEHNVAWLRDDRIPLALRYALLVPLALTWRFSYYAANAIHAMHSARERRANQASAAGSTIRRRDLWLPWYPRGRDLVVRSWLVYGLGRFVALPALLALWSPWAAFSLAVNLVLAELYANLHSFVVIVPNHAGGDLYSFDRPATSRAEFQLRQILGSVNYRCGGDWNDFLHGFLNYQIEHHLWPSWTPRQYQRAQPRVRELCARHGVPYAQAPVLQRVRRLVRVAVGIESSTRVDTATEPVRLDPERVRAGAGVPIDLGVALPSAAT